MTDVFIPSLTQTRVIKSVRIRRERLLPMRGAVMVAIGNRVGALDIVAKANWMGHLRPVPLGRYLRTTDAKLPDYLLKKPGEDIAEGEVIASKPEFFGTLKRFYRAPAQGRIAALQGTWLAVDLLDAAFELKALYRGSIINVMPRLGVVIEATGALAQGVWGAGGEGYGVLRRMVDAPDGILAEDKVDVSARGSILLAGAGATEEAIRRAAQEHAAGLIVGGLQPQLRQLATELSFPILVTEGMGERTMASAIFELLGSHDGDETAINPFAGGGRGTARPEAFIPVLTTGTAATPQATLVAEVGAPVRIVGGSHLGETGKIVETPSMPRALESGVSAWGAEIELPAGGRVFVPWENLELLG
jgi:hypothetical protein